MRSFVLYFGLTPSLVPRSLWSHTHFGSKHTLAPWIHTSDPITLRIVPPVYLHWDFRNLEKNTVWTGKNNQFAFKLGKKIPVWNIKLSKSKIPVRVVKNVISKWTKIWFPRFQFLWFTAVGVVDPPDQKLVMYISIICKKGKNS